MEITGAVEGGSQATVGLGATSIPSQLMQILAADQIQPGSDPSYELCKMIYAYHPIGGKMVDGPITMALSQEREISLESGPEELLTHAFREAWHRLGKVGGDQLVANTWATAKIYGIGALVMGARGLSPAQPLPPEDWYKLDLYFNVVDPLNTAGSLVTNQDPNSPDFQKPGPVVVSGQPYHRSNAVVAMNGQPLYILWTNSAYGFVGRSVYQRSLYPLKSFIQTMIMDDMISLKAGAIIYKAESPASFIDKVTEKFYKAKARLLKFARTGNVMTIGENEAVESLNLQNIDGAGTFARNNILKNIATGANMPASILNQETLAEGFGEGTEDAKQIARYIDRERIEMGVIYRFLDPIVQRIAWSPEFYAGIKTRIPEYKEVPYEVAFAEWTKGFRTKWPNLLVEPDSEKVKVSESVLKSATELATLILPQMDPLNKAATIGWLADIVNKSDKMFTAPLMLDMESLEAHEPHDDVP